MLIWGFFISTVLCWHATYTINSLSHLFGRQRYRTGDTSRNNWFLALLTLGEGWHNNHHYYPSAARQGFYWWEYDITYYLLKLMSWLGLIWDLKTRAGGDARQPAPPHPLTPRARRAGVSRLMKPTIVPAAQVRDVDVPSSTRSSWHARRCWQRSRASSTARCGCSMRRASSASASKSARCPPEHHGTRASMHASMRPPPSAAASGPVRLTSRATGAATI